MAASVDTIGRLLSAWTRLVLRYRKLTLIVTLAGTAAAVYFAGGHLGINTDTANMISDRLPWRQDFIDYRDSFPIRDRNLVAVIDASSPASAERFAKDLAAALRREPETFETVFLAGDGEFFEKNGLLYLDTGAIEDLSERLIDAQPMLGLIKGRANGAGVIDVVTRAVSADASIAPSAGLDSLYAELGATLRAAASGARRAVDWRRLIELSPADSERNIILIQPKLDFSRVQPARPAIERLRALAAEIGRGYDDDVSMRLTGTLAMEHEELESVSRGAGAAGIAAVIMVGIVLIWALRSARLLLISLFTLLVGLAGTAAFAGATVGHLNLLSVAFAVLYVGLGVDFILHICLRLKELTADGQELEPALCNTMMGVGTSLVICAITTAAGFYSFIPTPFDGVSELGWISGSGMLISLFASVTLLPALLAQFYTPPPVGPRRGRSMRARHARRFVPKYTLGAAAGILIVCAFGLPRVSFDSNPVHLRDPNSESVVALEELAETGRAGLLSLVAIADNPADAERWAADLENLDEVGSVSTVATLVPGHQAEKLDVIEDTALVLGPRFADVSLAEPAPAALLEHLVALHRALGARGTLEPEALHLLDAVDAALAKFEGAGAGDPGLLALDRDLIGNLGEELRALAKLLTANPFDRDSLPAELKDRWVDAKGRELIEIVPSENVNDNAAASRFIDAVRGVLPSATGLPVVYREASNTVVLSFKLALTYAFVLVTIILYVFLRSVRDSALVLAPIIGAAVVTAGVTGWLDMPFNFANIIALPLLVGVGVDNGIHMVHRMRTEPPKDGEPLHTSTSRAVLASGLTTIASFGNLAFSAHVGMSSMGKLLTLGMSMTMAATLIVLPAILRYRARS